MSPSKVIDRLDSIPPGRGATLVIDLDAVAANYRRLVEAAPAAEVAAVVKADAYGLGAERVAPVLWRAGCRTFFVALANEGAALRPHLPDGAAIAVLNGPALGGGDALADHFLMPVLNDLDQIDAWRAVAAARAPPAILHVDTGMNRLGLSAAEVDRLVAEPKRLAGIAVAMVMSHLACADEPRHPMNRAQLAAFATARAALEPVVGMARASLANAPGIFLGADYHLDMVRPGVAIYGVNAHGGDPNPFRQVVHLYGRIQQIRHVDRDMTVGYGAAHRVRRGARLATVAVGYADGYPRSLSNRGRAFIGETPVPLVGRVSMDLITLDVSAAPAALPGSSVELIGAHLPVDEVAEAAGTIGYEILTALGRRYHRVYVGGGA